MTKPDYGKIALRLEDGSFDRVLDGPHVMELLGYETVRHVGFGVACRPAGSKEHLRAIPKFNSADEFVEWVIDKNKGTFHDLGMTEDRKYHYVGFETEEHGNDYGQSENLGRAMWAAFVYLYGEVDRDA